MKYYCILSTCPDKKKARALAGFLISRRLAACVQVLPGLESYYWWRGKKETAREVLLLIKTTASCYKKMKKALLENHPYKVPEIICLPIAKGHPPYLDWISREVASKK